MNRLKSKKRYETAITLLKYTEFAPLLLIRLVLAYGFLVPAIAKWKDVEAIGKWMEGLSIPVPYFSAQLVVYTETLGVILLTIGLGTRLISIPLIIILFVAIVTVHWNKGFAAQNGGIEVPLYYILMLVILIVFGAGTLSVDHWVKMKLEEEHVLLKDEAPLALGKENGDFNWRVCDDC